MEDSVKCPKCGKALIYEDTYDGEGSIIEGYLIEHCIYTCKDCKQDYCISLKAKVQEVEIMTIEEYND